MEQVVLIGRGRPSLGSIAPCIALAQHINFQEKGLGAVFLSYGIGFKMLEYYDFKKIDLNYFSKGDSYPGLKMNDGIYPNFDSVIKKINPFLVINCGEMYVPKYCEDKKIPCVSIANLSYLDILDGWFGRAHSRLIEMASKCKFILDYRFFYERPIDEISEKVLYIGPLVRKLHEICRMKIRKNLGVKEYEKLILVLRGAAEDYDKPIKGKGDKKHFYNESNKIAECSRNAFETISDQYETKMIVNYGFSRHCRERNDNKNIKGIIEMDFVPEILPYIIASDLIITRAGLNTLNECCYFNKPTIAVPISDDFEQLKNADHFTRRRNTFSVESNELSSDVLTELSFNLLTKFNDNKISEYQQKRDSQISRSFDKIL